MQGMKDKVVVITGASAGIGAALAQKLARAGAKVVLAARREKELNEVAAACGPTALPFVCDVTRRGDVDSLRDAALAKHGRIDVWVNNAGRGISKPVSALTDDDIDQMMLMNVKSVLYGMQAVLPTFRAQKTGQIINVSSMLGRMPLAAFRSAYSASKHAMNALTANLRMELRAELPEVTVTVVHPGIVATEFGLNALHGGMDSRKAPGAQTAEEVADVIADAIEHPRADVYTRPGAREMVVAYYAAEDMGAAESKPPFMGAK
jgi:NADP-dependent 3-hydroxy acid dehydrogenase YdfG